MSQSCKRIHRGWAHSLRVCTTQTLLRTTSKFHLPVKGCHYWKGSGIPQWLQPHTSPTSMAGSCETRNYPVFWFICIIQYVAPPISYYMLLKSCTIYKIINYFKGFATVLIITVSKHFVNVNESFLSHLCVTLHFCMGNREIKVHTCFGCLVGDTYYWIFQGIYTALDMLKAQLPLAEASGMSA